jgi:hypothetical protein
MTSRTNSAYYKLGSLSAFFARGEDYAEYRPTYPATVIDTILQGMGKPSQLTAADVGAGTGIASRLLATARHPCLRNRAEYLHAKSCPIPSLGRIL